MSKSANNGYYRHQVGSPSRGAVLDVGLKCTHSCRFCYYSFMGGAEDQFLGMRHAKFRTLAECKQILDLLKQNGFINFDYTGGEPCLHPNIVEITRYAHQELGLKGRIITLGQWLTEKKGSSGGKKLIDDLLDAGLTNFLFSLHAANEDLFARSTGEKYSRLLKAMRHLDEKGFQYTSNTTVYEWNYNHLPDLAREIVKHGIYLHNFIIMNAYYAWNKDGKAFGVQAKYSNIYPYLMEAVDILESNGIGVNIRYAPLCTVRGKEKNLVGIVGVRHDPYEWMNMAGHMGGSPEYCASVVPIGEIEKSIAFQAATGVVGAGVKIIGARGNLKYFCEKCTECGARDVCDGIDLNYLNLYGTEEFTPYEKIETPPLHSARSQYEPPFLVKTEQFANIKSVVAETFKKRSSETIQGPTETIEVGSVKVSVIIPCYNYGRFLADAVESVVSQTMQDFEIIIVNDGSTDSTEQIANDLLGKYPSHRIILINQPNSGQPAISRNNGISCARGEFILCLDADDKIAPTMLSECVRALEENPKVSIAYTDSQNFGEVEMVARSRPYDLATLRYVNQMCYCSVYRRKAWDDVGGYRLNVKGCEDWDFWIAAGARGHSGIHIPLPLFLYRRHDTGLYQDVIQNFSKIFAQIVLNNSILYTPEEISSALNQLGIIVRSKREAISGLQVPIAACNKPEPDIEARFVQHIKSAWHGNLTLTNLIEFADQLQSAGQFEMLAVLYQDWLANNNTNLNHLVYFNLGVTLGTLDRLDAAKEAYMKSIDLSPLFVLPHFNLGAIYEKQGQLNAAIEEWTWVLNNTSIAKPDEVSSRLLALNNLGRVLEIQRNFAKAYEYLSESLRIEPDQPDVIHHWVFLRARQCIWPVYAPNLGVDIDSMRESTSALAMIALTDDPAKQLSAAKNFVTKKLNCNVPALSNSHSYGHDKIRVAYLSSDLCVHPVGMLTVELIELHDRQNFEIYGFCWTKEDNSALRRRIVKSMDRFYKIDDLSDEAAAKLIREHEIDIVVDLHGQTLGARPGILAYRPAPTQITYLGLPATTGLPFIDYMIVDRFLVPEEFLDYYSEKPLYMPDVYQVSDRKRPVAAIPTRSACGLPEDGFVFCSFNNNYKYMPEMFSVWMNILRRVPGSVLWLLSDNAWAESNMRMEAAERGIDCDRLVFAPRVAPETYYARYGAADLFLDTFPFNAGTTANDALWMGLPVLTCSGRTFASRMAGALLTAAGLDELITYDFAAYEEKAVELANAPQKRLILRKKLRQVRECGPLFDTERFTRNLEAHFTRLVGMLSIADLEPAANAD